MKPALVDVPVLVLFFNRPEPLAVLFEQIKKARPSKLLLYQDGPRSDGDLPGIEACRRLLENIDWECEVHTNYQTVNAGCDPSEYNSQKWAFSLVDKCVFFDDDDVPAISFFSFCKELLDRYENDTRIAMITATNYDEITDGVPYDYFFTSHACINGWATWKRVVDQWDDESYSFLSDEFNSEAMAKSVKERKFRKNFMEVCRQHRNRGKAYYESLLQASLILDTGLCIVPTRNLLRNQGALPGSTHVSGNNLQLPKGLRKLFAMKYYEIDHPLRHPRYIMELPGYRDRVYKVLGYNHPWLKVLSSFEELFFSLRHGNFRYIGRQMKNRALMLLGLRSSHY